MGREEGSKKGLTDNCSAEPLLFEKLISFAWSLSQLVIASAG